MASKMFATPMEKSHAKAALTNALEDAGISATDSNIFIDAAMKLLEQFGPLAIKAILSWLAGVLPSPEPIAKP